MSLTIPALDHGKIRVFTVAEPVPAGLLDKRPEALRETLGADGLDPDFIDVFKVEMLDGMTVTNYLRQGYDLTPDAADQAMLQDLRGVVVLVMSRATGGAETTLTPASNVNHVTTVGEDAQLAIAEPLESPSSQGVIETGPGKKPKSDARIGGMVATLALVFMMLLVGLMVWVGG